MPSRTDELPQEAETHEEEESLENSSVNSATSTSSVQQQESTQTASPANQSDSPEGLSTSPSKPTAPAASLNLNITPIVTAPTQAHQRTISSPSSLQSAAPTPSLLPARGPYFSNQPAASGIEARSPAKRAPASRSSHGIPTAHGPPPALITQRSYHAEPWRTSATADTPKRPTASPHQPHSHSGGTNLGRRNSLDSRTSSKSRLNPMNGATPNLSVRQPDKQEEDDDTLRLPYGAGAKGTNAFKGITSAVSQEEDQTYSSTEDLFLHLAHAESEAGNASDSASRTGRRGSHVSLSTSRSVRTSRPLNSRPTSSAGTFVEGAPVDQPSRWARGDPFDKATNGPYSSPHDRSYVASAHPLERRQNRYLHSELSSKTSPRLRNGSHKDRSPELVGSHGRRQSIESASAIAYRGSRQSGRSFLADTPNNTSPITSHTPTGLSFGPDGTESPASTTAPSTVWDELDDLKSRIRNLELTGKLPSPSGAAITGIASGRPRTATTAVTTASLSPNHNPNKNTSIESSTMKDGHKPGLHPLLQSALAKARTLVEPKVYKALESTASDALDLTSIAQGNPHQRQLRRKADNMCRSLTELCIALSEEKSSTDEALSVHLPDGTIKPLAVEDGQNHRVTSQEPDRPSSRIMSRLEARRTSLLTSNAATPPQQQPSTQEPTTIIHQDSSTPSRTSSVIFHRRRTGDSASFPTLASISNANSVQRSRSGSRAPEQRPSPVSRISREYTSQHPLPTLASKHQRSPSVQSGLQSSSRRSYFPTSASNSPHTPINGDVPQGGRRYMSATQPNSAEVQRQQRIASLGQFISGSRRLRLVDGESG
ncbi:MAG: hypothetical protein LQ350_002295 [Teloschistes chrysophthalmus]|nr:MAG: hypothetical protein LQ350_002295 [Niorma chrysophthalma]